jgi:oxygen-independent coproporphyrinogen-3 oxidase
MTVAMSDANKELIPLEDLHYINFYQYPPPLAVRKKYAAKFEEKLALSTSLAPSEVFTIFVSIPFCRSRCNSCTYFKSRLPKTPGMQSLLERYVQSIERQIAFYSQTERFSVAKCGALYIGGGTASVCSPDHIGRIVNSVTKKSLKMTEDVEITLEGNPSDLNRAYYKQVTSSCVNRLSIGYQSCSEHLLKDKIGSPHGSKESSRSVKDALDAGFRTVNIDMLYGIPGQRLEDWISDLDKVIKLNPESITIYSYIIHRHTLSEVRIAQGTLEKPIDYNEKHHWYLYAKKRLMESGYVENRKGNFAKRGHSQKYAELSYRNCRESIGIGAGAYGFINGYLLKATKNPDKFMKNISIGLFTSPDFYSIRADEKIMMERYVMQNLVSGFLSISEFRSKFNRDPREVYPSVFGEIASKRLASFNNEEIRLTELGSRWLPNILYAFVSEELRKCLLTS